jgi:hypothetical protein
MTGTTLRWNELRQRANAVGRAWPAETSESAAAQPFWTDWFGIFRLRTQTGRLSAARRSSLM